MAHLPPSILVVEPHLDTRALLHAVLSGAGFSVVTTGAHDTAVAMLAHRRPDLLVTGGRLPAMPLFSLLDHVRAACATRRLPVLLCTTAVNEARARFDLTFDPHTAVVFKPFDIDELVAAATGLLATAAPCLRVAPQPVLV